MAGHVPDVSCEDVRPHHACAPERRHAPLGVGSSTISSWSTGRPRSPSSSSWKLLREQPPKAPPTAAPREAHRRRCPSQRSRRTCAAASLSRRGG
eukprot:1681972-Prymnesium_polylepis.1